MLLPTRHPWECLGCRCVYVLTTASCRETSTFHFRLFPQRQSRLVSSRDLPSSPRTTRRLRLFPRETQASFPGFIMDTLSDKCMPMFTFTYNIESRTQHSLTRSLACWLPPRVLHTAETPHRWDVTYWLNTREDAHRSARSNGWSRMTCTFTEACSLTFSPLTGDSWLWMPKGELMLLTGKEREKKNPLHPCKTF